MNNSTFGGVVASALASLMIASTTWWYLRLQVSGGWFSATGDPSTVLPALAIVFLAVAVPFFLNGSGRFSLPFTRKSMTLLIISLSVLVTLSTGWFLSGEFFTPAAVSWNTYGFPLSWKVVVMNGCPPWCNLPPTTTTFNPIFFAVDSAFFLAIGLWIVLIYKPFGRRILSSGNPLRQFVAHHRHIGPKTLAALLIVIASIAAVETTMLWTAAAPTGNCTSNLVCNPQMGARLSMVQFWANSPTNATLKIMNYGPSNVTLQSYSVTDNANNQYLKSSWSGPTINSGVIVAFYLTIDGIGFTYSWGGMYTIKITTAEGGQYSFFTGQLGVSIQYVSLNTTTTAILNIANTGPPSILFNAYKVKDPLGHWSNNTSWAGPTVRPGMTNPADITIDGLSFTFQTGTSYTIYLYDTTGTEWTTYVTP